MDSWRRVRSCGRGFDGEAPEELDAAEPGILAQELDAIRNQGFGDGAGIGRLSRDVVALADSDVLVEPGIRRKTLPGSMEAGNDIGEGFIRETFVVDAVERE